MSFKSILGRTDLARRILQWPNDRRIMENLRIDTSQKALVAAQATGNLAGVFFKHDGRVIHKWIHYLDIYERYFAKYRNTPLKMLEIGVSQGGSLEMWRTYFGADATIFGVDINPDCAGRVTAPNQVRIGSQDDCAFLTKVIGEMGAPDIILDDGSHFAPHQRISFDTLFPLLKEGGLYVMEDLHTAYWRGVYGGGHGKRESAIGHVGQMIDDMHAWYHLQPQTTPAKTEISAIHVHDSIVVIEKNLKRQPAHISTS